MAAPSPYGQIYLLFLAGKLVINTVTRFVYAFLPAIARGLGVSVADVGALTSVRWLAGAATPVMVRFAGRERRMRVLLTGMGCFVAGALVTAATGVYTGALVGFALMGLAKPVFDSGIQAFVADHVPYERRARALGTLEMTWALSLLVGAPAAGWLVEQSGWSAPFWVGGFAVVIITPLIARHAGELHEAVTGPQRIVWDRSTIGFVAATILLVGAVEMVFVSFAAWLEEDFGYTVAALAVVAVVIGSAELAGEGLTVLVTDRVGKPAAMLLGMVVGGVGYVTLAAASSAPVGIGGLVLAVAGFEFAFVSSIPLGTELQPQARISFLSRFVVAQATGRAAAALAGVALLALGGIRAVALASVAAVTAAGAVVVLAVREHGQPHRIGGRGRA